MSIAKRLTRKANNIDSYLFEPINAYLEGKQAERSDGHSWAGMGYKFYPSAIQNINFCPKQFVEETVHTPMYFQLSALESMQIGNEFHSAYQAIAEEIPNFGMSPNYDYFESLFGREETAKAKAKLTGKWTEIPLHDPVSGFSMRMDMVTRNPAIIIDIKTIGQENNVKNKKTGEVKYDMWEDLKPKLAKEEHKLQVGFYLYFSNLYRLFPEPIKTGGVAYINTRMGNEVNKHETSFVYTDQMDHIIGAIVGRLTAHREAWLEHLTIPCEYSYCGIHGGTPV